jgi:hypothetical protein
MRPRWAAGSRCLTDAESCGGTHGDVRRLREIPKVHMPTCKVRQWRQTILHRRRLIGRIVQVKNGIRTLLKSSGLRKPLLADDFPLPNYGYNGISSLASEPWGNMVSSPYTRQLIRFLRILRRNRRIQVFDEVAQDHGRSAGSNNGAIPALPHHAVGRQRNPTLRCHHAPSPHTASSWHAA